MGGVLLQLDPKFQIFRPVEFMASKFTKYQKNWTTTEKEAFAILNCLNRWKRLLLNKVTHVFTDHKSLENVLENDCLSSQRIHCWRMMVEELDFVTRHVPGTLNYIADLLSRDAEIVCENLDFINKNIKNNKDYLTVELNREGLDPKSQAQPKTQHNRPRFPSNNETNEIDYNTHMDPIKVTNNIHNVIQTIRVQKNVKEMFGKEYE